MVIREKVIHDFFMEGVTRRSIWHFSCLKFISSGSIQHLVCSSSSSSSSHSPKCLFGWLGIVRNETWLAKGIVCQGLRGWFLVITETNKHKKMIIQTARTTFPLVSVILNKPFKLPVSVTNEYTIKWWQYHVARSLCCFLGYWTQNLSYMTTLCTPFSIAQDIVIDLQFRTGPPNQDAVIPEHKAWKSDKC